MKFLFLKVDKQLNFDADTNTVCIEIASGNFYFYDMQFRNS